MDSRGISGPLTRVDRPEYTRLSSGCDSEASAPGVFFWAGEHVVLSGGAAVCQQVPLRVWVGLKRRPDNGDFTIVPSADPTHHLVCHAGPRRAPSEHQQTLSLAGKGLEWTNLGRALQYLGTWATERLGLCGRYEFRSLHEVRPAEGCNWSGAFSVALVACVLQIANALDEDVVAEWEKAPYVLAAPPSGDLSGHRWTLGEVASVALRVETVLHGGRASGYGALCPLVPEPGPLVFAAVSRVDAGIPTDLSSDLETVDRLRATTMPIAALADGRRWDSPREVLGAFPITYGLVCSGRKKETAKAIAKTEQLGAEFDASLAILQAILSREDFAPVLENNNWLRGVAGGDWDGTAVRARQIESLGWSSIRVCRALVVLFGVVAESQDWEDCAEELAEALRATQGGLAQLGLEWPELRDIASAIYRMTNNERTAVKLTGGGRGGQVLIVVPREFGDGADIEDTLEEVRKLRHQRTICLDWLSTTEPVVAPGLLVRPGHTYSLDQGGSLSSSWTPPEPTH